MLLSSLRKPKKNSRSLTEPIWHKTPTELPQENSSNQMQTMFLIYWNWFVIHCDGLYSHECVNRLDVCFIWILSEAEAKTTLTTDYLKHMVPQVRMSNFNGTHLTKVCCAYLRYSLTPSERVWCKSLCSLQHHQIPRSTHLSHNNTTISPSTWHFSSNKNASQCCSANTVPTAGKIQ